MASREPKIYLPLGKCEKCAVCKKTRASDVKLFTCSACAEITYCSSVCQKKDWSSHKINCGKTDRIDFEAYYPFVAAVQYACHILPNAVQHPALQHQIVSSPNPDSTEDIVEFPNGRSAKLILLGDKIADSEVIQEKWWPTAKSPEIRVKLMRRIVLEGLLLPVVYATVLALVSEMYTTTAFPASENPDSQPSGRRRVRLQYKKSPIADIGIAKGTCTRVTSQDKLAYYNLNTDEFLMGQDPTDHYWIYFTTLDGEEYFLDCGMFTFNFTMMVDVTGHVKYGLPPVNVVPAWFYGKEISKVLPTGCTIGWKPDKRFSILRNTELAKVLPVRYEGFCDCHVMPVIYSLMDSIAGRSCTHWEQDMLSLFLDESGSIVRENLQRREYLNFPKDAKIGFDLDPHEAHMTMPPHEDPDGTYTDYLKKWTRRLKKGEISEEKWDAVFKHWRENPHEIGMRKGKGKRKEGNECVKEKQKEKKKESDGPSSEMLERMRLLGSMAAQRDIDEMKAILKERQSKGK